ncbi:MAG: DUF1592 domain-containing protein, partial [Planctomycetales bacterium]|nr:DUF1592 domain-containing protein [Planctomycetales bacterium]
AAFSQQWKKAIARVTAHDMPPEHAEHHPSDAERQMFIEWHANIKYLSPPDPGPFVIRRLTKTEYGNTLHDLFGVSPAVANILPDEVAGAGFLNSLSPLQLEHYLTIADNVLNQIIAPDARDPNDLPMQLFGPPPAPGADERDAARHVIRSLAFKAYRRPPSEAEVDVLMQVFDLGTEQELPYPQAVRLVLKAILVSPQFLFITPNTDYQSEQAIIPVDDFQLASRLSYFLWSTMPDEELMALAGNGKLNQPETLAAQVGRLLDDPRSRALFDGFGAQWLGIENLDEKVFDPEKFPEVTEELRIAMYDEARLFFESVVRENRSVTTFVDCDYTFLNEPLASIYKMETSVYGPEMRRVHLDDRNRGGVLGMASVLAATSLPNRTSPVKRGVWVLEQVLGDRVPSAPPDVPPLETQDQSQVAKLTLRERTEMHRSDPVCNNCHVILDPIGFGLENFDAIGRWRERDDNGEAIDCSGELPSGEKFSNPQELKAIISSRSDELARNMIEKLLAYALCRQLEGYDEIVVDRLMNQLSIDGYRMSSLVTSIVTSYPFTHCRIREE